MYHPSKDSLGVPLLTLTWRPAELHYDSVISRVPFGMGEEMVGLTAGGEGVWGVGRTMHGSQCNFLLDVSTHITGVKYG